MPRPADIEKGLIFVFAHNADMISEGLTKKVSTELPSSFFKGATGERYVQLTDITSAPVDAYTEAAHRPVVQVGTFGATKSEARELTDLAYDIVRGLEGTVAGGMSFGAVDTITGPTWDPDPDTDIPRYLTTFGIVTRSRTA